jgi:hypothetical protein
MKKLSSVLLVALLCTGAIWAEERVQKVIAVKNGNLSGIAHTIRDLLPGSSVLFSTDGEHLILSGPKDTIAGFEEMIKQLDMAPVAKKNAETTVYMIIASSQANNSPVPGELEPVITQLKGVFQYKGFRVLESFMLRSRSGDSASTTGFLPPLAGTSPPANSKITYSFRFQRANVDSEGSSYVVRYNDLLLQVKIPTATGSKGETNYADAMIQTNVDVPTGKKLVVGKTSAVEGSDSALFLVISAKVVD